MTFSQRMGHWSLHFFVQAPNFAMALGDSLYSLGAIQLSDWGDTAHASTGTTCQSCQWWLTGRLLRCLPCRPGVAR